MKNYSWDKLWWNREDVKERKIWWTLNLEWINICLDIDEEIEKRKVNFYTRRTRSSSLKLGSPVEMRQKNITVIRKEIYEGPDPKGIESIAGVLVLREVNRRK